MTAIPRYCCSLPLTCMRTGLTFRPAFCGSSHCSESTRHCTLPLTRCASFSYIIRSSGRGNFPCSPEANIQFRSRTQTVKDTNTIIQMRAADGDTNEHDYRYCRQKRLLAIHAKKAHMSNRLASSVALCIVERLRRLCEHIPTGVDSLVLW